MQLTDTEWEFIEPYLPTGWYGPYPERLRQQFEGVIWRFKTGAQWRETAQEFGAWSAVHNRFRQWRDAGVFEALLEGLIAEAAKRGEVDLSLVSIDSTTARARHDAAGMRLDQEVVTALEKAVGIARGGRSSLWQGSAFTWPARTGVMRWSAGICSPIPASRSGEPLERVGGHVVPLADPAQRGVRVRAPDDGVACHGHLRAPRVTPVRQ